jgi:hypothetical protein
MKTIATGNFRGESVRITSIWYNVRTEKAYCELYFGESGYDSGLRVPFDDVDSIVHHVESR